MAPTRTKAMTRRAARGNRAAKSEQRDGLSANNQSLRVDMISLSCISTLVVEMQRTLIFRPSCLTSADRARLSACMRLDLRRNGTRAATPEAGEVTTFIDAGRTPSVFDRPDSAVFRRSGAGRDCQPACWQYREQPAGWEPAGLRRVLRGCRATCVAWRRFACPVGAVGPATRPCRSQDGAPAFQTATVVTHRPLFAV